MDRKLNYIALMIVFLSCFFMCNSFGSYSSDSSSIIFENQFEKISGDKLYVKPGTIFVSSETIFLCCGGQFLPVAHVECDEEGVFVRSSAFKWGQCPLC